MFSYFNISKREIQTCRMRNSAEEEVIKKKTKNMTLKLHVLFSILPFFVKRSVLRKMKLCLALYLVRVLFYTQTKMGSTR